MEAAQLLDVEMQQIAGMTTFVSARWPWRLERRLGAHPVPRQDGADRGTGHAELVTDCPRRLPEMAEVEDQVNPLWRQCARPVVGAGWAITQSLHSFVSAPAQPLVRRLATDPGGIGRLPRRPVLFQNATDQKLSTGRGSPGILMDVHPGFSFEVDRLAPISFSGLARVNNPHRNHS
jgi:hypothetical protein